MKIYPRPEQVYFGRLYVEVKGDGYNDIYSSMRTYRCFDDDFNII